MSNYDYPSLNLLNDDDEDVYLESLKPKYGSSNKQTTNKFKNQIKPAYVPNIYEPKKQRITSYNSYRKQKQSNPIEPNLDSKNNAIEKIYKKYQKPYKNTYEKQISDNPQRIEYKPINYYNPQYNQNISQNTKFRVTENDGNKLKINFPQNNYYNIQNNIKYEPVIFNKKSNSVGETKVDQSQKQQLKKVKKQNEQLTQLVQQLVTQNQDLRSKSQQKINQLEQQIKKLKIELENKSKKQNENIGKCKACLDKPATFANVPCMHVNLCNDCAKIPAYNKACITCRDVGQYKKIFLSSLQQI